MAKMPPRAPIARSRPRVAPPGMKTKALPRTGGRLPPVVKDYANPSTFTGRPPVVKDYANPGYQPSNKISRSGASAKPVGKVRATLVSSKPLRSQKPPVGRAVPRTTGVPTMPRVGASPRLGSPANKGFRGPRGM